LKDALKDNMAKRAKMAKRVNMRTRSEKRGLGRNAQKGYIDEPLPEIAGYM
jgi:hypothetical protein